MEWISEWPRENPKDLARYVVPEWSEEAANLTFAFNHHDALQSPEGRQKIVKSIYMMLTERAPSIGYAYEDYSPEESIQKIRYPDKILHAQRPRGTCLDLSLLFCGLCLASDLLPTLIILQGHALAAVSLNFVLRSDGPSSWKSYNKERVYVDKSRGMLVENDLAFLEERINNNDYLPIECTGFAHSESLNEAMPEGSGRKDGFLSFERAVTAGKAQISLNKRPFQYALDICYLHYKANIKPYKKGTQMMNTAELASMVIGNILVPFLTKGAKNFAEQVGEKAGDESVSLATKVWGKVKSLFESGECKELLETFEDQPEKEKDLITLLLQKKLDKNDQLAEELNELIQNTETSDGKNVYTIISDNVGVVNLQGGSVSGSAIVVGLQQSPSQPQDVTSRPKKGED